MKTYKNGANFRATLYTRAYRANVGTRIAGNAHRQKNYECVIELVVIAYGWDGQKINGIVLWTQTVGIPIILLY